MTDPVWVCACEASGENSAAISQSVDANRFRDPNEVFKALSRESETFGRHSGVRAGVTNG